MRYSSRTSLAAFICAAASLAIAVPAANAGSYVPPKGKSFHGVSETGHVEHFRSFVDQTGRHSAISQSFFHWGVPSEPARSSATAGPARAASSASRPRRGVSPG